MDWWEAVRVKQKKQKKFGNKFTHNWRQSLQTPVVLKYPSPLRLYFQLSVYTSLNQNVVGMKSWGYRCLGGSFSVIRWSNFKTETVINKDDKIKYQKTSPQEEMIAKNI